MESAFGLKRPRKRPFINITPLIDVMFLLLIFFMVSSTFREQLGIDLELPYAATATEQERSPHEIAVTAAGEIFVGQQPVSLGELRQHLEGLIQEDPAAAFLLRADEAAAFQDVLNVIDVAREIGGRRLIIPTRHKTTLD